MLYNCLFDYTLKWLNETDTRSYKDIAEDSGSWGNYYNITVKVTTGTLLPAKTGAIKTIEYKGGIYSDFPTSSNNIFDIAGNAEEWTMSMNLSSNRSERGGYCNSNSYDYPVKSTSYYVPYYCLSNCVGVRSELLIR